MYPTTQKICLRFWNVPNHTKDLFTFLKCTLPHKRFVYVFEMYPTTQKVCLRFWNVPNHIKDLLTFWNVPNHIKDLLTFWNVPNHIKDLLTSWNVPNHTKDLFTFLKCTLPHKRFVYVFEMYPTTQKIC